MDLKKYGVLIRPYSVIDLLLLFMLARTLSVGNRAFHHKDIIFATAYIFLWFFLTLVLEAKHKHPYRKHVSYIVPYGFLTLAIVISLLFSKQSLLFVFFVWFFSIVYIKKDEKGFFGLTSFLWRGLYEVSIFLFGISLYANIWDFSLIQILIGISIFFIYSSRNLIADIRDVAFDKTTFTVKYGSKTSYVISLVFYIMACVCLFVLFSNYSLIFPILIFSGILLFYDNGYVLHRCSIILTSFMSINLIFLFSSISTIYFNILFIGILSNLILYDETPRKSNPISNVRSRFRFLFSKD